MKTTGMGIAEAALLILSILIVVGVIGSIVLLFLIPKEQAILDTTTFVLESREYSERLEAGQVIHVSVDVISNGPVVVSIWNDDTWDTLWESDFIYEASLDLTAASSGIHIFEIVNFGDYSAKVRIKVSLIGSEELGPVKPTSPVLSEALRTFGYPENETYSMAEHLRARFKDICYQYGNTVDRQNYFRWEMESLGFSLEQSARLWEILGGGVGGASHFFEETESAIDTLATSIGVSSEEIRSSLASWGIDTPGKILVFFEHLGTDVPNTMAELSIAVGEAIISMPGVFEDY